MTKIFKNVFIDTNVLIYQTFEDFDKAKHIQTTNTIQYLLENNAERFISPQVIREFFSISTNGKFFEKPLNIEDAIYKCNEYQKHCNVLLETEQTLIQLYQLVREYQIIKKNIHDANIVATMLSNDIRALYTFNIKDFSTYKEIEIFKSLSL